MPQNDANLAHVAELIGRVKIAMLTTADPNGELRSRPMAIQQAPFDGTLRFFTRDDSGKVDEIDREHEVNVAVSCPEMGIFVSVTGSATLERNRAKIDELWSDEYKVWFPGGKEDPHLAILRVKADYVEYWETPQGQPKRGYEAQQEAKDESEYGKVQVASS